MNELLENLSGSTVLVTGATGLIGKTIINDMLSFNESSVQPIKIIAAVRNKAKADRIFGTNSSYLTYVVGDITTVDLSNISADYIIHAASQTSSKAFVNKPVESTFVAVDGTRHMLEYARSQKNLKKFVYLSTMEVYGTPQTDEKINEDHETNINTVNVRSCYPESKRMCENLCISYMKEYDVPVNIIRLTQTFGPGVDYNDGRVFAEFARCAIENKDIILKTEGKTKRSYLYTEDAVSAILTVMEKGKIGEAYNAANESTYCSIREMAGLVADKVASGKISVKVEQQDISKFGYAPTLHMNLDTEKLKQLGWTPAVNLEEMYKKMIKDM